jgi:hypothetical protein
MSLFADRVERVAPALTEQAKIDRLLNAYYKKAKPDCDDPFVQRFDWQYQRREGRYWVGAAKVRGLSEGRLVSMGVVLALAEITPTSIRLIDVLDQGEFGAAPKEQAEFLDRARRSIAGEAVSFPGSLVNGAVVASVNLTDGSRRMGAIRTNTSRDEQ